MILTLNYYRCPMLCGLMLNGVVDGLDGTGLDPGCRSSRSSRSASIRSRPQSSRTAKKQNYIKRLERPSAAKGWHFLTGRELEIKRLAETLGFSYTYDPETAGVRARGGDLCLHARRAGGPLSLRHRVSRQDGSSLRCSKRPRAESVPHLTN